VENTKSTIYNKKFMIIFMVTLMVWSSYNLIQTVVPLYMSLRMGASLTEIGVLISISTFSTMLMRPFLGYVVDRGGRRATLVIALLAFGGINIAYMFAKTPISMGLIRFVQGIPFAAATTALGAIASDLIPPERRGEGLSYFTLTNTLAIAIGPSVGIALFNTGWHELPFMISFIVLILCLLVTLFIKIPDQKAVPQRFEFSNVIDFKTGWLVLTGALVFFGVPGIMTYSTLYSTALGIENISMAYTMYGVGLVVTRFLTAKAIDEHGGIKMGRLAIIILAIGFCVIGFISTTNGLFAGSVILAVGIGIITPTLFTMAVDLVDQKRRGSCTAMIYTGFDMGIGFGSLIFGWISDATGNFGNAYLACGVFELAALLVFLRFAAPYYKIHVHREFSNNTESGIPEET
jgi:MFS family permease